MEMVDGTPPVSVLQRRPVRRVLGELPEGWLLTHDAELKPAQSEHVCFA